MILQRNLSQKTRSWVTVVRTDLGWTAPTSQKLLTLLCGILSECFNMRGFYPGRCPGLICSVLSERFNALVFYPDMRAVTLAPREVEKPSNVLILAHATSLHTHPSNKRQANCPERTTHTSLGQRPRNGIRRMIAF